MVREIITEWAGPGANPKLSIMYFNETSPVDQQRAAINAMFNDMQVLLSTSVTWNVRLEGRELNTNTGLLEDLWSDSAIESGTGSDATTVTPDAVQALLRWRTNTIIGGRLVQGRTFVPGFSSNEIGEGNLGIGAQNTTNTAMGAFLAASVGFVIWHRPVNGAGGSAAPVTSGSVWTEWAIQRRRRG